jgi:large subunit ribosomal protein L3
MAKGILGTKVGMTQIFAEDGTTIPVTVVQAGPCVVVDKMTAERNDYSAVKVGFLPIAEKKLNKPELGVFKKAGVPALEVVREFRLDPKGSRRQGRRPDRSTSSARASSSTSQAHQGKGFQGVVRRHA